MADVAKLQCPKCRSQKLEIEATARGSLTCDFSKKGPEAFVVKQMQYGWAPEAAVKCLACNNTCTAAEAMALTPLHMLMELVAFVRQLPLEDGPLLGARVTLLKKSETLMKEHSDKLREPL